MVFDTQAFKLYLHQPDYFQNGELIFDEGTMGGLVYVISEGEVEIFTRVAGKEIILDRLQEGEVLGEVSFFDQHTRSAGARAVGRVGLMQVNETYLSREYENIPPLIKSIIEAMSFRLRSMIKKTVVLATDPEKVMELSKEFTK